MTCSAVESSLAAQARVALAALRRWADLVEGEKERRWVRMLAQRLVDAMVFGLRTGDLLDLVAVLREALDYLEVLEVRARDRELRLVIMRTAAREVWVQGPALAELRAGMVRWLEQPGHTKGRLASEAGLYRVDVGRALTNKCRVKWMTAMRIAAVIGDV